MTDQSDTRAFLECLFQGVEWEPGQSLALRGLAEKNSSAPNPDFRDQQWVAPAGSDLDEDFFGAVEAHIARWNAHGRGAFVIPAVMKPESIANKRQTESDVLAFTSIVVDLDNPDTAEDSLVRLEGAIGPASIVSSSSPGKLHAYWVLSEPCEDVARIARLRHVMALKSGGDPSFMRVPQVIRLAGSLNGKNDSQFQTVLVKCDPLARHDLDSLEEWIEALYPMPWSRVASEVGGMDLLRAASKRTAASLLTETVSEGGTGTATRWDAAGKVFGHYVHTARTGEVTIDEARELARGWMLAHMDPPWTDDRFARDWAGVVALDVRKHGPIVVRTPVFGTGELKAPGVGACAGAEDLGIRAWATHRWVPAHARPVRKWLVKGLIRTGATHVLASEGGVGKTFALLDLCMKIAAGDAGSDWLGQPVDPAHTRKTAVLLTAEDDQEELQIRLFDMDPHGRRFRLDDRVIVLPLVQAGGVFQLVEIGPGGVARATAQWARTMEALATIEDLGFVGIDTMAATLHGEENSSIVIQQYITALNLLRSSAPHMADVATLITHHVRKQSARDAPIQSAGDMRQAIRGSNALMGAARMAIGIWQPPDWADRLARMELPKVPGSLFRMAVVKGNNPEAMEGERTLVRAAHGGLMDATARDKPLDGDAITRAWVRKAVERAVEAGKPYSREGRINGITTPERRDTLPPVVKKLGRDPLAALVRSMVESGALVVCDGAGLDLPGGQMATDLATYQTVTGGAFVLEWDGWVFDKACQMVVGPNGNPMD